MLPARVLTPQQQVDLRTSMCRTAWLVAQKNALRAIRSGETEPHVLAVIDGEALFCERRPPGANG